jgi:hypothetical protein
MSCVSAAAVGPSPAILHDSSGALHSSGSLFCAAREAIERHARQLSPGGGNSRLGARTFLLCAIHPRPSQSDPISSSLHVIIPSVWFLQCFIIQLGWGAALLGTKDPMHHAQKAFSSELLHRLRSWMSMLIIICHLLLILLDGRDLGESLVLTRAVSAVFASHGAEA